ncbi:MAG: sigma-70 family RNA polymerase sigma factor [Heliobacteriaceae bacterium]|nr:sigma-70 family RNA polymerase sigma factor [Heliobacteriaceae bacterium]
MSFKSFGKNKARHDIAEFIFKNYYKTVYHTAYKYCDNHSMAEEAAQETIFQAIKNLDQLKDAGKLESWLKVIARNTVFKMLKALIGRITYNIIDFKDIHNDPVTIIENEEIIREIQRIILDLKEPYHAVMVLYYYKNSNTKEISSILNISEGTVKSILSRGRNKVKSELIKKGLIQGLAEGGEAINEIQ